MLISSGKRLFKRLTFQRGYTMVELVLIVAIIGVVSSVGAQLLINLTRFQQLNTTKAELQREARSAIDLMNRNMRQAKADTVTVDQATGQPPYSRITFTKANDDVVSYYQNDKLLYQTVNGTTSLLSKNLRYLAFAYQDASEDNIISISITLEQTTFEGKSKALKLAIEKVRIMN